MLTHQPCKGSYKRWLGPETGMEPDKGCEGVRGLSAGDNKWL